MYFACCVDQREKSRVSENETSRYYSKWQVKTIRSFSDNRVKVEQFNMVSPIFPIFIRP